MPKTKIQSGAVIETLSQPELSSTVREILNEQIRDWTRGLKVMRFTGSSPINSGAVSFTANSGPESGYVWMLRRISFKNLAAADVINIYRTSDTNARDTNYIDQKTGPGAYYPGTKAVFIVSSESLLFIGSSLTATGTLTINGEVVEVPAEMIGKIL
jgi:hypothetical protein